MKKLFLATMLIFALAGCSNGIFATPQQAVFASKAAYEFGLRAAVAYRELPACSATVKLPCHDPVLLRQIRAAQPAARAVLDASELAVNSPGLSPEVIAAAVKAADSATRAFTVMTDKLPAPKP